MRFCKCFTTYLLAKELDCEKVLVLTWKPAVEGSWRADLKHVEFSDWEFVGRDEVNADLIMPRQVRFASFQDALGRNVDGLAKEKNLDLLRTEWDLIVIDEYHYGAHKDSARTFYLGEGDPDDGDDSQARKRGLLVEGDPSEAPELDTPDLDHEFLEDLRRANILKAKRYLFLSGTPFRALAEGEFLEEQIFNWTYTDEQREKNSWLGENNPYEALPELNLLTYKMPEKLQEITEIEPGYFSLNEFFKAEQIDGDFQFKHINEVQAWLNLLRGQGLEEYWPDAFPKNAPKMVFGDKTMLELLRHTVWFLPSVAACHAMGALLAEPQNKFFNDFKVVVVAGKSAGMGADARDAVDSAIGNDPETTRTITLTCGKLLTGVSIAAWSGIFMLLELRSPETYFQAAFRVQTSWTKKVANLSGQGQNSVILKKRCYIIDFAPNRALSLLSELATKLNTSQRLDVRDFESLDEFVKFLPVLAFDGYEINSLSASDILDYVTQGLTSGMLAKRFNSRELLRINSKTLSALLSDSDLINSLEKVELFRDFDLRDELTAIVSANESLSVKRVTREKLNNEEKQVKKRSEEKRSEIIKKLQTFVGRLPVFMYLTDTREQSLIDLITVVEPELFSEVTMISVQDFEKFLQIGIFDRKKMDDAVWKFRVFEDPSLTYLENKMLKTGHAGWEN